MIPKTRKKKIKKINVFASSGRDLNIIRTSLRNLGILFTVLNGLITLKALKPLTPDDVPLIERALIIISETLISTTKKSKQFQPLLKYEFLCFHIPCERILINTSTTKQYEVTSSIKNNF